MRGSVVVLALVVSPLVASVSQAQQRQNRPHWRRHDLPAAQHVDRKADDKKCEDKKQRGNPSQTGFDHRADPRLKGNKDCDLSTSGGGSDQTPPPAPDPAPAPAPDPVGHTGVQGSLFFDIDHDGMFGPDEVALAGWTVMVSGPMAVSAVTDGNGFYSISGLTPGIYTVCVMAPAGWTQTAPSAGTGPTCSNATIGIALEAPALVGDVIYSDVDFGFVSN
jgi:SdrD B-like domain